MAIEFKDGKVVRTGNDEFGYSYDELFNTGSSTAMSNTDDFRENPQVVQKSENVARYLNNQRGIGSMMLDSAGSFNTEDINETMRDFENRLETKISAISNLQDAPQDVKDDMLYLIKSWEQVSPEGAKQWTESIYDNLTDFVFNPETALSLGAGVATLGTGTIATKAAAAAAKRQVTKKLYSVLKATTAASVDNPYKSAAIISGLYGGADELLRQDLHETLGDSEGRDYGQVALTAALSTAVGPMLIGGVSLASKGVRKLKTQFDSPRPPSKTETKEDSEKFESVKQLDLFDNDTDEVILNAMDAPRLGDDAPEGTQGTLFDFDETDSKDPVVATVKSFVSSLGGGERTQSDIFRDIRNASKNETTREGKRNAIHQTLYNAASSLTANFYGKTAGILDPITALSGTAQQLQKKLHHDFGIEDKALTAQQTIVAKDLFEVQREVTGTFNERFREIVEELSLSNFSTKMADDVNAALSKSLRSTKAINHKEFDASVNKSINRAAGEIRELYSDMGTRLNKIKVIGKLTDNYVPRMWSKKAIEANPEKLEKLFVEKAGMTKAAAKATVKNMQNLDNQIDSGNGSGYFFSAKRKINSIGDDADFEEFLNSDVLSTLHAYTFQAGKSIAKHRVLGVKNFKDFEKFYINRIKKEVESKGEKFTPKMYANIEKLYRTQTGEGLERYGRTAQTAADAYSLLNRTAYLGLVTVSSLTEIMLNISKAGVRNSVKGLGEALQMSHKRVTKDLESVLQNQHGLTANEAFSEMRKFSIYIDQEVGQLGDRLTGDALVNETMQNVSNKFFRLNMLDQWTKFVQNVSYRSGKSMIQENIEALSKYKGRDLDKRGKHQAGELAELGIDYKDAVKWYESGANVKDSFYKDSYLAGAARYTNSVILQPTGLAGNKPFLMANPKTSILFQLMTYPAAFSNTVLKSMYKQTIKAPVRNLVGKIAPAALLMTGMARYTNYLRTNGESEENKDLDEILYNSVARWGGNGLLIDSVNRARTSAKYTKNSAAYLTLPFGPIGSDAMSLYQQGIIPTLGTKVPVLSGSYFGKNILGDWRVKQYRKGLREKQEEVFGGLIPEFDPTATTPGAEDTGFSRLGFNLGSVARKVSGNLVDAVDTKAQKAIEYTDDLMRPLADSTDNLINSDEIERVSRIIEGEAYEVLTDNTLEMEASMLVESLVVNSIKNPNLSITKLSDFPKLEAALESKEYDDAILKFAEARDELAVDDAHFEALEIIQESKEKIDPEAKLSGKIAGVTANLKNIYRILKVDLTEADIAKAEKADYDSETLDSLHDFLTARVKATQGKIVSNIGAEKIARDSLIKIAANGNVDLAKFKPPKKLTVDDAPKKLLSEEEKTAKMEEFLKDSKVKQIIFRAKRAFKDAEYFMSFAIPREMGAHLGNEGAADNIKLRDIIFDYWEGNDAANLYAASKNQITQKETNAKILEIMEKALKDEKGTVNLDDYVIEMGVVNLKNPLVYKPLNDLGENEAGTWDAVELFIAQRGPEELLSNLEASGTVITDQLRKDADAFVERAHTIDTKTKETALDTLEYELMKAELNMDVQQMLKDLGYDGIQYQNKLEKGYIGDDNKYDDFSYIAFDPEQFKSVDSVGFDSKDRRHKFMSGSIARKVANFVAPRKASGLYSTAHKEAAKIKDNQNTGDTMLKRLENKVPAEELEWTGANDYFKGKQNVTREEVVDFFDKNDFDFEVNVGRHKKRKEGVYDDDTPIDDLDDDFLEVEPSMDEEYFEWLEENHPMEQALMDDLLDADDLGAWDELHEEFYDKFVAERGSIKDADFVTEPSHIKFSFEGEDTKNYREMVLTLPDKYKKVTRDYTHKGHHPTLKNQLLHIRFADIEEVNNPDAKTLLIDELQSDKSTAASGKEGTGYQLTDDENFKVDDVPSTKELDDEYSDLAEDLEDIMEELENVTDPVRKERLEEEATRIETRQEEITAETEGMYVTEAPKTKVPNLPLKKEKRWAMVGLRKAMIEAAENNYDQVALSTGKIQVLRNSKEGTVDTLSLVESDDGTKYFVQGIDNARRNSAFEIDFESIDDVKTRLPKVIGEEKTNKLLNAEADNNGVKVLEEEIDFSAGGQKFYDFYDKTLPKLLKNNFGKDYGIEIKMVEYKKGDETVELPTLKITPELRKDLLQGQQMFSEGGYVVSSGDTLSKIAQDNDMTVQQIAKVNNITDVNKIYVGQKLRFDLEVSESDIKEKAEKVKSEESLLSVKPKEPEELKSKAKTLKALRKTIARKRDSRIPINIRAFVSDIFGGGDEINENSLTEAERKELANVVKRARNQGKSKIEYADYSTEGDKQSQYADVGGGGGAVDFFSKVTDPAYSLKTTLGQAKISVDEEGNTVVTDQYNFNDSDGDFSVLGLIKGIKRAGLSPYAQIRNIAREFGSGEGEGAQVKINLGKLASNDVDKLKEAGGTEV